MLSAGTRVGPYEVVAPLGAGGMGEVYRTRDTRLKRDVALKVLPQGVAHDPERLARFQREAEALAALQHPSIAAIYGLEHADGTLAIAMELVEGETLADRIARGPIPFDEARPLAAQIADALEAAHEKGIVHRDLKPANIKLTANGGVKLLDFGLAKLAATGDGQSAIVSGIATVTSPALITGAAVILGTAAYMSPEQARGRAVDKRTDIWAFGCVPFEMLSGRRAFDGEDVTEAVPCRCRASVGCTQGRPDYRGRWRERKSGCRCLRTERGPRVVQRTRGRDKRTVNGSNDSNGPNDSNGYRISESETFRTRAWRGACCHCTRIGLW